VPDYPRTACLLRTNALTTTSTNGNFDKMIAYFGYGSLVNRDTRPPEEKAYRARLQGWERHWAHRVSDVSPDRLCTSLSARPASDQAVSIDGVVVLMDESELPALDKRESGYFRQSVPISHFDIETDLGVSDIAIYQSLPENFQSATEQFPILQSYVDCVMAGYSRLFGEQGLQAFMGSTKGWDGAFLNERHKPLYPRAISLSAEQVLAYEALIRQYR